MARDLEIPKVLTEVGQYVQDADGTPSPLALTSRKRVGINTLKPQAEFDVMGTVKATKLDITGMATLPGANLIIENVPDSTTLPLGTVLQALMIDPATGKIYRPSYITA